MITIALAVLTASALGLVLLCAAMSLGRRRPVRATVERSIEQREAA